jgi:glycosyltransferase involved in cell wall biosynthesis
VSNPLITVIMPLKYYHHEFLQKAMQSIIQQSCPHWHLAIVVEKTDFAALQKLLEKEVNDPRIALIINQGMKFPGAINTGMRYAKTDFASILLADDMWANDAVEILSDYITKYPQVDFFHSSRIIIDENDTPISPIYYSKPQFSLRDFRWGSPVKHLLCWRKDKGLAVGGIDESILKAQDDYDFPWTMAENGATFQAVRECLYYYRNHCACERLTTHRPLSVAKRGIRGILKKHGVGFFSRILIVAKKRISGSLGGQSLYRNTLDRWIKEKLGHDARRDWRQSQYR